MIKIKTLRTATVMIGTLGSLSVGSTAFASTGCDSLNNIGQVTPAMNGGYAQREDNGLTLEAGEVIRHVWTSTNAATASVEVFVNGVNQNSWSNVSPSAPASVSYTVPSDGTYSFRSRALIGNIYAASDFSIAISCTPASGGGNQQEERSQETTSKAVTSAVSRSQTTVIEQNIGARVATVIGSAGAGTGNVGGSESSNLPGSTSSAPAGGAGGDDDTVSFAGFGANDGTRFGNDGWMSFGKNRDDRDDDQRNVMRRLAMTSSFDSSVLAANMARESAQERTLALGPTDDGTVGGAAGVDGRAALSNASPITVWGHGSYTSVDNDYNNGTDDNRYDGDVWGYNLGADYRFENNLIAGLSVGYNDTDLTTAFNDGSYEETAWVVSPYAIFSPIENLNVVAEAGYSQGDVDVTRDNEAVNGSTESEMWYASVKAIYAYRPMEDTPLTLSPSVSALAARKTIDGYLESDGTFVDSSRSNTRQIKPAVEAAYDFGFNSLIVTPFVETGMIHDFTDELNNDKTAFNIGGGVRLSDAQTGFNAALEGSYLAGRSDYTEYTIAGTVSYGFELRDLDGQPVGFVSPFFGSDVDEYGNQFMKGGVGFDNGLMASRLALAHGIAESGNTNSQAQITMSLKF
ncbi:autotransporter outer membrane beta-barrel domain-containing protein [Thalassospira sp. MA62]|nr:autotransporter outer membrane beta-barrel domain-containing protein [Thalassospira sp. MA62]